MDDDSAGCIGRTGFAFVLADDEDGTGGVGAGHDSSKDFFIRFTKPSGSFIPSSKAIVQQ